MFQWRLKLREARLALAAGRVEEARRLLQDRELREFLPAKQLAGQVANKYAERARRRIAWGESAAGLADLDAAGQIAGEGSGYESIRHGYALAAAEQAIAKLAAGQPEAAAKRLDRTRRRGVTADILRDAHEVASEWLQARRLANGGEMAEAAEGLSRAERLARALDECYRGQLDGRVKLLVGDALARERTELEARTERHTAARERLHASAAEKRWDEALGAVEETLRLAPADKVALALRRRLWRELGLGLTASHHGAAGRDGRAAGSPVVLQSDPQLNHSEAPAMPANQPGRHGRRLASELRMPVNKSTAASANRPGDTSTSGPTADRRMLWVDAVGGFLVCLDDEVLLGQPSGSGPQPAAPILADISRRHAVLSREAGSYVLRPLGEVQLDGRTISDAMVLGDSHTIRLGAVEIKFTKPHALSSTARLEITSGHRTAPSSDGILLMADSCILGPGSHSHVRCHDWSQDVILFRKGNELRCRSTGPIVVNGAPAAGPAPIEPGSRIEGEDFAMSVELA